MLGKWWIVILLGLDFIGRKLIAKIYGGLDQGVIMRRVYHGQVQEIFQGALLQAAFSAVLWSLLPLWVGVKTKQLGRGCLLALACFSLSMLFPLLNLGPIVLGIVSYFYLLNRSGKEF